MPDDRTSEHSSSRAALRQSEERFRIMVEAVKDYAIFLLDPGGHIASWNAGAERIKGYTAEEIHGKHFSIFYPQQSIEKGWPEYELKVAKKDGRFEDEGWRLRKDGTRFWANVVITALWDDGVHLGFTKVTRDLTERRIQEERLRQNERELAEAYREVTRRNTELQSFAHVASHDLQEPLRKISVFSDLLASECSGDLDEDGRLYVDRIQSAADRMSALIRELMAYSRASMDDTSYESIDLNDVLKESLETLQVRLEETGGRVDADELPNIAADPTQMQQLFQNLIGNALKFHRPGVPPVVRIATRPATLETNGSTHEAVEITIQDNGIGFESQRADQLFEPFHRLHRQSEYEGTGLGLAICRRIVERLGGSIAASSAPGEGALFTVVLPVRG